MLNIHSNQGAQVIGISVGLLVVHEKENRTGHLSWGDIYKDVIIDVMGRKEIFKGKWVERKMRQAVENILRNYSTYGLEERHPWNRQRNQKQKVSCKQK